MKTKITKTVNKNLEFYELEVILKTTNKPRTIFVIKTEYLKPYVLIMCSLV